MTDLTSQAAIVAESARGLGKAIAKRYACLGASVVVDYSRRADGANDPVNTIGASSGHRTTMTISETPM